MRLLLPATAAVVLAVAAPAMGAGVPDRVPMLLPGDATAAGVRGDARSWLLGARRTSAARRLVRAAGGRRVVPGGWEVPRAAARPLARRLRARGLLTYAEPNRLSTTRQQRVVPNDPLAAEFPWRDAAVDPALAPPAVTPESPMLALVDAPVDLTHPEFAGGNVSIFEPQPAVVSHGTATTAVAAAPINNVGIVGVWPGMRAINVPVPSATISCSASARGIIRSVAAGAAVINMSYGSGRFCNTEYRALQVATAAGLTLVAAAGNEFGQGNPLEFPASLPHVLTVGAMTPSEEPAYFSNRNAAMDLVAPGIGIVTAVPVALDDDGTRDGYQLLDGTSFAAPMVAAAAAWVRAARPGLTVDQIGQLIRLSARDIGADGYDASTGFGRLDLGAALTKEPLRPDPLEPNEDIVFVDGAAFDRPAAAIWNGTARASVAAYLDAFEDPGDVYRIRVPGHTVMRATVTPEFGNPDVELYSSRAKNVTVARHRLTRSRHTGQRTDRVRFANHGSRTRTVYLRVFIRARRDQPLDAGYALAVR